MRIADSELRLTSQYQKQTRIEVDASTQTTFGRLLSTRKSIDPSETQKRVAQLLQSLLEAILAALNGSKCRSQGMDCRLAGSAAPALPGGVDESTWRIDYSERISESEQSLVEARGRVQTADGRQIDFRMVVDMKRQQVSDVSGGASGTTVLHDPLIVNFSGTAAELNEDCLEFDLNGDGGNERLPGLTSASGYLVLDKNSNGRADDGRELFGPTQGNGFSELAALDDDGNGWIDEADAAYSKLRIWRGGSSPDQLKTLAEAGVGALCVQSAETPFSLRGAGNSVLGEIRATGVWLAENGRAGSLQQVDLVELGTPGTDRQVPSGVV